MKQPFETWCRGILNKYPASTLAILARLCEAGLKNGQVSANDLQDMVYPKPQLVGACFKLMKRIGFTRSGQVIASTRKDSHASFIFSWELANPFLAQTFLSECRQVIQQQEGKEEAKQQTVQLAML